MKDDKNTKIPDSGMIPTTIWMILILSFFLIYAKSNAQTFNSEGVYDLEIISGTSMTIDADGAHGGYRTFTNNPGGSGGDITATFNVNTGDFIRVIVGQAGSGATNDGGGGGGTAVINCGNSLTNCDNNTGTLLIVAGAGGGAGINSNGGGAVTTAGSGGNGSNGAQGNSSATQASCNVYSGGGSGPGDGYGYGAPGFAGAGGGGAGYTGGDGVAGQNGAEGGSNFIDGSATSFTNDPGATGGSTNADGIVTISGVGTSTISSETCAESILPVELINFYGELTNKKIELNWTTVSEINNLGFELHKSNNGRNWQEIDFVEGRGTTSEINEYQYQDLNPISGINYYRLKQIDFDGESEYSKVIAVNFSNARNLQFFPNPVSDRFQIIGIEEGEIIIMDYMGRIVLQTKFTGSDLNISKLTTGLYFLKVSSENKTWTRRLIKK